MIHLVIVGVLVILSTGVVYFGLTNIGLLPQQASQQAVVIDSLFNIQWFFISFFFSLIMVFLIYSVVVFRRRPGEQGDGAHFEGNTRLEVIWTVVPLVIVLSLSVIGAQKLGEVERRDPGALVVNVTASQFQWRFEYPEHSNIVSDTLVLPVGKQVVLRLRSEDVIHSFWVPEFRVKQDVLPGGESFMRELRITPTQVDEFTVRCAELCGDGHAKMTRPVSVRTQAGFDQWVIEQSGECELPAADCGERWANIYCTSCHVVEGDPLTIAPTWVGIFGSTEALDDGTTVLVDEDYLYESIVDPNAHIVQGYLANIMPPDFAEKLTEQQIQELIAFIISLAE